MNDDLPTIQRVLEGDVDAFRLLVERYQRMLFALVGNLVSDRNDCDDIAQETFLAAYVGLGSYDACKAKFSTWLLTIARHKCLDHLKKRRPVTMEGLASQANSSEPAHEFAEADVFARLDDALAALPFEQKSAFVLSEIQGFSHEEISQIEAVPLGTVKSRISRAKEKLRSLFSDMRERC